MNQPDRGFQLGLPGRLRASFVLLVIIAHAAANAFASSKVAPPSLKPSPKPSLIPSWSEPPKIETRVKPAVKKKVLEEKEVMSHAELEDAPSLGKGMKKYSFYSTMLVHAGPSETRRVLTDYKLYAQMIPYIEKANYDPKTRLLNLEGGLWKFKLISTAQFEERGDHWIHYRVVGGHFTGMEGDIYFEPQGEKGTWVFLEGRQTGTQWPPTFVIERGAEIVFGFTGKRMRSYIESQSHESSRQQGAKPNDPDQIPQPRRGFSNP